MKVFSAFRCYCSYLSTPSVVVYDGDWWLLQLFTDIDEAIGLPASVRTMFYGRWYDVKTLKKPRYNTVNVVRRSRLIYHHCGSYHKVCHILGEFERSRMSRTPPSKDFFLQRKRDPHNMFKLSNIYVCEDFYILFSTRLSSIMNTFKVENLAKSSKDYTSLDSLTRRNWKGRRFLFYCLTDKNKMIVP